MRVRRLFSCVIVSWYVEVKSVDARKDRSRVDLKISGDILWNPLGCENSLGYRGSGLLRIARFGHTIAVELKRQRPAIDLTNQ